MVVDGIPVEMLERGDAGGTFLVVTFSFNHPHTALRCGLPIIYRTFRLPADTETPHLRSPLHLVIFHL